MKLLVDARVGWGHGIGRMISNTVPHIARLRPDWQIDVLVDQVSVTAAEAAFGSFNSNLSLKSCSVAPFSLAEQAVLARYARGYDLCWFTNYWVPLTWRGPFVATVHDMLHLMPEFIPTPRVKRLLARHTFNKVRRDARGVMFVSRSTERAFHRMIGKPRLSEVIQLGGDHLDYGVLRPIFERKRQVMVVAASKKHKNFEILLESWRLAEVAEDWRLIIVSPAALLRSSIDVETLAANVDRTEVRRGLTNDALAALYADSAILLMPSLYEGFGLPLLEGLLAGALCISSNAEAMIEVAEGCLVQFVNGKDRAGWTASIEQACAMIDRSDPALSPIMYHNIARARRLRWEDSAKRIISLLSQSLHP